MKPKIERLVSHFIGIEQLILTQWPITFLSDLHGILGADHVFVPNLNRCQVTSITWADDQQIMSMSASVPVAQKCITRLEEHENS